MQRGMYAALADRFDHASVELRRITSPDILRMRAHTADLLKARRAHPFAGHRHQRAAVLDAAIPAERMRASTKKARECERRQLDHGRRIVSRELYDVTAIGRQ